MSIIGLDRRAWVGHGVTFGYVRKLLTLSVSAAIRGNCSTHVCVCEEVGNINATETQCPCIRVFVGRCLATTIFIGKLPATGGLWVMVG